MRRGKNDPNGKTLTLGRCVAIVAILLTLVLGLEYVKKFQRIRTYRFLKNTSISVEFGESNTLADALPEIERKLRAHPGCPWRLRVRLKEYESDMVNPPAGWNPPAVRKLTLSLKDEPALVVLNYTGDLTGMRFRYEKGQLVLIPKVEYYHPRPPLHRKLLYRLRRLIWLD